MKKLLFLLLCILAIPNGKVFASDFERNAANSKKPEFKVLVLTERGGFHEGFVVKALEWLDQFSKEHRFEVKIINHADEINDDFLANYKVIIQLNYPPYMWSDEAKASFIKYIQEGKGGWVGFHHASLLGEFDGYPMWEWFSQFLGGIRYKNYIEETVDAVVKVEDAKHPVMKHVSPSFVIEHDEWYIYDKSPRPQVHVLAHVDESTYKPASDIKMGDHPVIWTNNKVKARNVYFQFGHHADLLSNKDFTTLFGNAIIWASGN